MIKAHLLLPTLLVVALLAILAQTALVRIVFCVAGKAVCGQLHFMGWFDMAALALERCVCATKREFRLLIVIERRCLPAAGRVAIGAGRAVTALVDVIALVA